MPCYAVKEPPAPTTFKFEDKELEVTFKIEKSQFFTKKLAFCSPSLPLLHLTCTHMDLSWTSARPTDPPREVRFPPFRHAAENQVPRLEMT